jgi:hypothetical protein
MRVRLIPSVELSVMEMPAEKPVDARISAKAAIVFKAIASVTKNPRKIAVVDGATRIVEFNNRESSPPGKGA